MKIVEDYAQRKIDERDKEHVINLDKRGFSLMEIAEILNVSLDFVEKALSEN